MSDYKDNYKDELKADDYKDELKAFEENLEQKPIVIRSETELLGELANSIKYKKNNIFDIKEDYLILEQIMCEIGGELSDEALIEYGITALEFESLLKINQDNLEEKCKAYHYIMQTLKGETIVLQDEINRLSKIEDSKQKSIERFKEQLRLATIMFGDKGKTGNEKLSFDNLSLYTVYHKPLHIEEFAILDDDRYVSYTIKTKLNKEARNRTAILISELLNIPIDKILEEDINTNISKTELKKVINEGLKDDIEYLTQQGVYIDKEANYLRIK